MDLELDETNGVAGLAVIIIAGRYISNNTLKVNNCVASL
jgi:hypothetical protein